MIAVRSEDPVLNWLGATGLAHSAGTALIVDFVGAKTRRTLGDIVEEGPSLDEINPGRAGVARIAAGLVDRSAAKSAVDRLSDSWPAVVVALDGDGWDGAVVPYRGLYPGLLAPDTGRVAVWQSLGVGGSAGRARGPVLPPLAAREVRAMLAGRRPRSRRWVDSWSRVWDMPWA